MVELLDVDDEVVEVVELDEELVEVEEVVEEVELEVVVEVVVTKASKSLFQIGDLPEVFC